MKSLCIALLKELGLTGATGAINISLLTERKRTAANTSYCLQRR